MLSCRAEVHMRIRKNEKLLRQIWRINNRDKRNEQKKRNYERGGTYIPNYRMKWTAEMEREIMAQNRPHDRVLALKLGRSVQAIQVKRARIKSLQKDKVTSTPGP